MKTWWEPLGYIGFSGFIGEKFLKNRLHIWRFSIHLKSESYTLGYTHNAKNGAKKREAEMLPSLTNPDYSRVSLNRSIS
jgi:hypothetical protein